MAYCERRGSPAVELSVLGKELAEPEYGVSDAQIGPKHARKHVWKGIMLRKDLRGLKGNWLLTSLRNWMTMILN